MKSSPKRKVAFKTESPSKRSNFLTGLKHKFERHVRHTTSVIPDDLEISGETLEDSAMSSTVTTESETLAESKFEQREKSATNMKKNSHGIGQEITIFLCPECSYWNRWVTKFHDHMLGHHNKSGASYRCSKCDYADRFRSKVNLHIRKMKKNNVKSHSKARAILIHPVPADKYADYRRAAVIEKGLTYGWIADAPSSECKNLNDLTNNLEKDFESTPSVESLDVEEVELRKEIVIARKAMLESLSNTPKKEKKCAVSLDKLQLQIDATKVKIKSTEQEFESLSTMKSDLQKKIKDVAAAKLKAEYEFRSHQCKVLSLQLAVEETSALPEVQKSLSDVEKKTKCKEKELERKEAECELFRKEYDSLKERSEQAEETLAGAYQDLYALEAELKVIQESGEQDADDASDMTKEQIKDYMKLEKRLLKITYLKSLSKVCQQEKIWLDSLQRHEEEESWTT